MNENQTDFVAALQKRSEEVTNENGTEIQIYDDSDLYETILKKGAEGLDQVDENSTNLMETNSSMNSSNSSDYQGMSSVLMVFRFSLKRNGKIINFTFPKEL